MNYHQFVIRSTEFGTGKHRGKALISVPLSYLFWFIIFAKASKFPNLFEHDKTKALVEVAYRRNKMKLAVRTMKCLEIISQHKVGDFFTSTDISAKHGINIDNARDILRRMKIGKLLSSKKGVEGGYVLNQYSNFTLLEVERMFATVENKTVIKMLSGVTLKDFLDKGEE